MNRVLVTGASGFIGHGVLAPLVAAGLEVHAVSSRSLPAVAPEGVHWHVADLLVPGQEESVLATVEPQQLVHLAWYAEPGLFWTAPENLRWVEASVRLLRGFVEVGGRRAVMAGSCAEYEWQKRTHCDERSTPLRPATLYGASKQALFTLITSYAEQVGLSLAWGRVFFVFGPREHPARLAGSVARALVLGEPVACTHGEQLRDFLYSEDVADAFVALLRSNVEGPVNLASGRATKVRELVEALAASAGRPDLVRLGERQAPAAEPTELLAEVRRLREEVGWIPPATLEQRAAATIAWWRQELNVGAPPRARV